MLLTLEGIDGSGKTTTWNKLQDAFPNFVFTREPTDTWYGDAVYRSVKSDESDSLAELLLYTADHRNHLETVIEPAIANGDVVICDRYFDSRLAYQSVTLADELENPLEYIDMIHQPWSRLPDKTIFLDVDPQTSVERSEQANKFEQVDYLDNVYRQYNKIIRDDPQRFVTIDSSNEQSIDNVVEEAVRVVSEVTGTNPCSSYDS